MANLQETLDALQPNVIGIRYIEGMVVVDCIIKDNWLIPESKTIISTKGTESENYYMLYGVPDKGVGLDDLLNYVKLIINVNKEREDKHKLLKDTVESLKKVFKNNSLAKLKTLRLIFKEEELLPEMDEFDLPLTEEFTEEEITPVTAEEPLQTITPTNEVVTQEEVSEEEKEILEEELRGKRNLEIINRKRKSVQQTTAVKNNVTASVIKQNIELPPVSTSNLNCSCGEDEACDKCIDQKGF